MTKSELENLFSSFEKLKILVIGDVMLDAYILGKVNRISPEAPVPIVNVEKREKRLGGAANVALNIKSLGAKPILCSVIGNDSNADDFFRLLDEENLSPDGILISPKRITTQKTRMISQNQQLLRFDEEIKTPISKALETSLITRIKQLIIQKSPDAIIFEDYDKGVITPKLIEEIISAANQSNIPTLVDPKKRNFNSYHHATLFKPNLKEFKQGVQYNISVEHIDLLFDAMNRMRNIYQFNYLMTTLSDKGIAAVGQNSEIHLPAEKRSISDVSGAGDTVISVAALCLSSKLNLQHLVVLSNLAGGLVCELPGVVPIDKDILKKEAKKYFENKMIN